MLQAQSTDISRQIHQVRGLCLMCLKLRHHAPCVTATISQQPSHPVSCQFPRLANILFTRDYQESKLRFLTRWSESNYFQGEHQTLQLDQNF